MSIQNTTCNTIRNTTHNNDKTYQCMICLCIVDNDPSWRWRWGNHLGRISYICDTCKRIPDPKPQSLSCKEITARMLKNQTNRKQTELENLQRFCERKQQKTQHTVPNNHSLPMCRQCYKRPAGTAFKPCNHYNLLCQPCSGLTNKCPECAVPIESIHLVCACSSE